MNTATQHAETTITRTLIEGRKRMGILPKYAGPHMMRFENAVYDSLQEICTAYNGGMWLFYEQSNGTFYMAPNQDGDCEISVFGNHYEGTVSADAAGLIATLMAANKMAWATRDERFTDLFYGLRDYASQHKEAGQIFRAID